MNICSVPAILIADFPWFESGAPSASSLLLTAIICLIAIIILLLIYLLSMLLLKNRHLSLTKRWLKIVNIIIQNAIFHEDEEQEFGVAAGVKKLLKIKIFRLLLISELLKAKRSFSGSAGKNLDSLFLQYQLHLDSLQKLKSSQWHLKAQGIQELAIMGKKDAFEKIYAFTNDKNEQVRIEAQTAVVLFSGFEGLQFLDFLTFPISQWQQIKLLTELGHGSIAQAEKVGQWLSSANNSVIIFSLKLIAKYHLYELHEDVLRTLSHEDAQVRTQAIITLRDIYNEETARELRIQYYHEELPNKLAVLEVLRGIGTEEEIPFLLEEFERENNQLKLSAGRAIAEILREVHTLENSPVATRYPWSAIVQQIKGERAA